MLGRLELVCVLVCVLVMFSNPDGLCSALEKHRGMHCKKWAEKELPLYMYVYGNSCFFKVVCMYILYIFSQCTY